MKSVVADLAAGILMLAIALVFLFEAVQLPPPLNPLDIGSAAFPILIISGLIICSLVMMVQAFRRRKQDEEEKVTFPRGKLIGISMAILIAYAFLIPLLGYYLATGLAFIALLLSADQKSWAKLVFVTSGFLLFAWICFENILQVPLP